MQSRSSSGKSLVEEARRLLLKGGVVVVVSLHCAIPRGSFSIFTMELYDALILLKDRKLIEINVEEKEEYCVLYLYDPEWRILFYVYYSREAS